MRVGANEYRLIEHLNRTGSSSVREAADTFGAEHGVKLTTVLQMMERLRKKGLLTREQVNGVWVYSPVQTREDSMKGVVKDFVERTLGGSLEPLALYLADRSKVSPKELEQLRAFVDRLSDEVEEK